MNKSKKNPSYKERVKSQCMKGNRLGLADRQREDRKDMSLRGIKFLVKMLPYFHLKFFKVHFK